MMIHLVSCLIVHPTDQDFVLGMTLRNEPNDWVLPGGKVISGESPEETTARLTYEKTGIYPYVKIKPLLVGLNSINSIQACANYLAYDYDGNIKPPKERLVEWVPWNRVVAGTFGQYAFQVQNAYLNRNYKDI